MRKRNVQISRLYRHGLRECRPPRRRMKGVCEVLRLVDHLLMFEFHDAHRVAGHAVVCDCNFAHPQIQASNDLADGEMPVGGMPAALWWDRRSAPEPLARLRVVEDRVRRVHGVLGLSVPRFRCLPVFLNRGSDPSVHLVHVVSQNRSSQMFRDYIESGTCCKKRKKWFPRW